MDTSFDLWVNFCVLCLLSGLCADCVRATWTSYGSETSGVLQVGRALFWYQTTGVAPGNISTGRHATHIVCVWNAVLWLLLYLMQKTFVYLHFYMLGWNYSVFKIFVATVLNRWLFLELCQNLCLFVCQYVCYF